MIPIEWYTNYTNSSYEIWISDDNADYTSIDVVSDGTTYQYPITEDFEKRYFKISLTTNYGEYIESIPFVVTKTESGYSVDLLDSDGDGLPDVFEIMFGTNVNAIDSDDDGLTDYQEVYITGTDPTKYDSVTEGVSDADADSDEDGLSNAQEIELGTDPLLSDTDDDNLSDYDEIYVYGTDPLNPDTDGDGLEDGDELHIGIDPHICLDPTNPETFGIPDAEYKVEQTISTDSGVLSGINTAENAYELSIDIKTNGYAEKEVTVSKSSYSYVIENDAMIGLSADIFISDTCNPEEIVLKYNIKEAYIDNTLNLYSSLEEFQGIKRLNIFKFHEDKNMLLPVETKFDVENGLLYAEVDELGTYCIMDMEIWLNNLGVEMPEEIQHEENAMYFNSPSILSASEDSGSVWTPTYINAPIDLVFMIDSDGNYKDGFESEKSLIANICGSAFVCYKDVRVHIISCTCSSSDVVELSNGKPWFENINEVQKALNSIKYTICDSNSKRNHEFNTLINEVKFQDNSDRFIYMLYNHGNIRTSQDSISSLDFCRMKLGIYSEILPGNWYYRDSQYEITLKQEITDNNGLFIEMDSDTPKAIAENIKNNLSYVRPVYEIIIPTKWKQIYLDGELSPDNGIDTDKDTLTDWEEVKVDELIKLSNGNYTLPKVTLKSLLETLKRYDNDEYLFITGNTLPTYYLPILSDPTEADSDGDGLNDINDPVTISSNNYSSDMIKMNNPINVTKLQKCLEYLGYLDMQGQDYGIFGGLSIGATQLFQLNYHMFSNDVSFKNNSDDSYSIDKNTYYAIIREAQLNGFTEVTDSTSCLSRNYIPKSMPLEEFNASLNPDNPVIISSVVREDYDRDDKFNDKVNIYIYDYTPVLDGILRYGAQEFHFHHYQCSPSYIDQNNFPCLTYGNSSNKCAHISSDYVWMILQVKDNAPYDVKTKGSWDGFMARVNADIRFSTSSFPFLYYNEIINAEIFGNILYGFAGHAGGFSATELKKGGSLYSYIKTKSFDNAEDSYYIQYGYDLYSNVIDNYNYLHITR